MKKRLSMVFALLLSALLCACGKTESAETRPASETVDIQILATSDLHGKFMPWDYLLDCENSSGSMTQLSTAIRQRRNENTLLLDAGDTVNDNLAELFINDDVHPMIRAMNYLGYDACTTGNHEYNYDMPTLRRLLDTERAAVLVGNVYDEKGERLAEPYGIFERSGVRIAVIGMVTPNITRWDRANLEGWTVTNPVEECRQLLDALEGKADVFIALVHMGLQEENALAGTSAVELAKVCPEFDLIIAAHDHNAVEGEMIGKVLAVENKNKAQTMSEVHLTVEKSADGCKVTNIRSELVDVSACEPDAELTELLMPCHERALTDAHSVIGRLEGGDLKGEDEIAGVSDAQLRDTALMDLILRVQLRYSGADVASSALTALSSELKEGEIRKCDVANIYKYINTLYTLRMTGAQLRAYMEWSARYYQQYHEGDLTIAFDPDIRYYSYDVFAGVNYEIDISKSVGERIVNLCRSDGTSVADDDSFVIAVNNYRATSQLLTPGIIFPEGELPELLETDIHDSDIGDIRALILDYIVNVCHGVITPEVDNNWRVIGNSWDEELHQKAVEQLRSGLIELSRPDDKGAVNDRAVTVDDLK